MTKVNVRVITLLLFGATLVIGSSVFAQDPPNRAALVVRLSETQTVARCVEFVEPEITGLELIERSGLAVAVEFQTGGAAVCSIDGTGCPSDDCFCQCKGGGDCIYWSYWQLTNGSWNYALAGASAMRVEDGQVHGWSWGPGSVTDAIPPEPTSFEAICTPNAPPTDTPVPTSPPVVLPTLPPAGSGGTAATITPLPTATATLAATTQPLTVQPTVTAAIATLLPATATAQTPPGILLSPTVVTGAGVPAATSLPVATSTTDLDDPGEAVQTAVNPETQSGPSLDNDGSEQEAPTPTMPAVASDGLSALESEPGEESNSIENEYAPSTPNSPVAVVGDLSTSPGTLASNLTVEELSPQEGFPAAQYALFGALVTTVLALFGVAYLRRSTSSGPGE